jgi:intracellular sulfur oxidation DsrE/DsrF family protein
MNQQVMHEAIFPSWLRESIAVLPERARCMRFISRPSCGFTRFCRDLNMLLLLVLLAGGVDAEELPKPDETPELEEILYITRQAEEPEGVLMHTREYDESAFYWVAPRLEYYVMLLRKAYPSLPLVILSHGDEMSALTLPKSSEYPEVHKIIRRLVETHGVDFQVCGRFAAINNLDESDFPDFVHMIPSAPTALADYRDLGYELISIELTW